MAEENVKKPNKVVKYLKDLKRELKNIVWSPKKDVIKNTTVVVVVTAVSAIAIAAVDMGLSKLLSLIADLV